MDFLKNSELDYEVIYKKNLELEEELKKKDEKIKEMEEENLNLKNQLESEKKDIKPFFFEFDFVKNDSKLFQSLSGFFYEDFQEILGFINLEMDSKPTRNTIRIQESYKESRFKNEHLLFMTLIWLRHYPKNSLMRYCFNISAFEINMILNKTITSLIRALSYLIEWPSDEKFKELMEKYKDFNFDEAPNILCVIDGTEIKVPRPQPKLQKEIYSAKKKQHSLNFQIITLLDVSIIFVSKHQKGANDQKQFNELRIRDKFVAKDYGLVADGGYTLNRYYDYQISGFVPFKNNKKNKLTEEQKSFNKKLSQVRVVVENTISNIKNWDVISSKFRHFSLKKNNPINIDEVFHVCCLLTQFKLKKKPLRSNKWMHPSKKWYFHSLYH